MATRLYLNYFACRNKQRDYKMVSKKENYIFLQVISIVFLKNHFIFLNIYINRISKWFWWQSFWFHFVPDLLLCQIIPKNIMIWIFKVKTTGNIKSYSLPNSYKYLVFYILLIFSKTKQNFRKLIQQDPEELIKAIYPLLHFMQNFVTEMKYEIKRFLWRFYRPNSPAIKERTVC